ncbi:hypothetical protein [Nibribacter koreensis]|uniref:Uncharacterized protein n=1 Tax=Nibribacter koreensis TaxID=1084519 RepID=A0ABP8G078_9BACT
MDESFLGCFLENRLKTDLDVNPLSLWERARVRVSFHRLLLVASIPFPLILTFSLREKGLPYCLKPGYYELSL